jgi:hypothetical protein
MVRPPSVVAEHPVEALRTEAPARVLADADEAGVGDIADLISDDVVGRAIQDRRPGSVASLRVVDVRIEKHAI